MLRLPVVLSLLSAPAAAFLPARQWTLPSTASSSRAPRAAVVTAVTGDEHSDSHDYGAATRQALVTAALAAALSSPLAAPPSAAVAVENVQVVQGYEAVSAEATLMDSSSMWLAAGPFKGKAPAPKKRRGDESYREEGGDDAAPSSRSRCRCSSQTTPAFSSAARWTLSGPAPMITRKTATGLLMTPSRLPSGSRGLRSRTSIRSHGHRSIRAWHQPGR